MVMDHDSDLDLELQIIPGVVSPQEVTVTVSAPGLSPPYLNSLTMKGGEVQILEMPDELMVSGSQRAPHAVFVTATDDICEY